MLVWNSEKIFFKGACCSAMAHTPRGMWGNAAFRIHRLYASIRNDINNATGSL
jgi:hypothetical protein